MSYINFDGRPTAPLRFSVFVISGTDPLSQAPILSSRSSVFPPKTSSIRFFHTLFQNTLCSVFLQISFSQALPKSPSEKLPLHVFYPFHYSSAPCSEMSLSQTTTVVRWWCPWPCVHVAVSPWRSWPPYSSKMLTALPGLRKKKNLAPQKRSTTIFKILKPNWTYFIIENQTNMINFNLFGSI